MGRLAATIQLCLTGDSVYQAASLEKGINMGQTSHFTSRMVGGVVGLSAAFFASGCIGEASGSLGDRTVIASGAPFSTVRILSCKDTADLEVAHRTVHVTESKISWDDTHSLQLPEEWKQLELREAGTKIVILVDGVHFGAIDTTAKM